MPDVGSMVWVRRFFETPEAPGFPGLVSVATVLAAARFTASLPLLALAAFPRIALVSPTMMAVSHVQMVQV